MGEMASQITSLAIVYSFVYSDADQRKHQSSGSLAFVWGIHRGPVNSPHKWPVTRKMSPFDDVIKARAVFSTAILALAPVSNLLITWETITYANECWIMYIFSPRSDQITQLLW